MDSEWQLTIVARHTIRETTEFDVDKLLLTVIVLLSRGLVAVTEKYLSATYFDKALTGARADQEVLKELIVQKLPTVYQHLTSIDIELSTVTLNWFLAIFFDAVPFQVCMLRSVAHGDYALPKLRI